jgi:hypothetical protein
MWIILIQMYCLGLFDEQFANVSIVCAMYYYVCVGWNLFCICICDLFVKFIINQRLDVFSYSFVCALHSNTILHLILRENNDDVRLVKKTHISCLLPPFQIKKHIKTKHMRHHRLFLNLPKNMTCEPFRSYMCHIQTTRHLVISKRILQNHRNNFASKDGRTLERCRINQRETYLMPNRE